MSVAPFNIKDDTKQRKPEVQLESGRGVALPLSPPQLDKFEPAPGGGSEALGAAELEDAEEVAQLPFRMPAIV